ncbi:MAG: hypothetical protein JWR32_1608 [Mycobacterium sp.]|jgi:hypothetical protein|nr:hypothetical protein [Mycobacterium sp.]
MNGPVRTYDWPSLMVDEWTATRDTFTGAVPYRDAVFDVEFDFVSHMLAIRHSDGGQLLNCGLCWM